MKILFDQRLDKIFKSELTLLINSKFHELITKEQENNIEITINNISEIFKIGKKISTINVFDNSQFYNQYRLGGMISWNIESGFLKKEYKVFRFNNGVVSDFHMMKSMLSQRISQIKKKNEMIDLFLIDGGIQQKSAAVDVMNEEKFEIDFICIAKGKDRNARNETFFTKNEDGIKMERSSKEMLFLEKLRDEAHNFIINQIRFRKNKEII